MSNVMARISQRRSLRPRCVSAGRLNAPRGRGCRKLGPAVVTGAIKVELTTGKRWLRSTAARLGM